MANNQKYAPHRTRHVPVADGMVSGAPYMLAGNMPVVLLTDEGKGGNKDNEATVALDGCFRFPIATATALAVGAKVYYITASKSLTTTDNSAANPLYGYAMEPKGTSAGQVIAVELAQV